MVLVLWRSGGQGFPKMVVIEGLNLPLAGEIADKPSATTWRNKSVRGAPASSKTSVVILLRGPGLAVGAVVTEWGNLNAVGGNWVLQRTRQVAILSHQGEVVTIVMMDGRGRKQQSEQCATCRPVVLAQ